METLLILIAIAITLMALEAEDRERHRGSRERQFIPVSTLVRGSDEGADTAVAPER